MEVNSTFFEASPSSPNQKIIHPLLQEKQVSLYLKREDQLHPFVSGNKFRKLKYNLSTAQAQGYNAVLTFGGAYSNHIAATAAAARIMGMKAVGVIRGEELAENLEHVLRENATLGFATAQGMHLQFISREQYRNKESEAIWEILGLEPKLYYLLPEGGTNSLAIKGCEEILTLQDTSFDCVCCAVGTGGTIAGVINSSAQHQKVYGFPALKGDFLRAEIEKYTKKENWELISSYHFGGYGKINRLLVEFINTFNIEQQILLDPVYTAKMVFGIFDMIKQGYFKKNTRILAIHTGGLQGIAGMNKKLQKKRLPLIKN